MNLSDYKIAIFTRSMNYSLYKLSDNTILLPFKHYRLTFTNALGYLEKILKYDIDYAINIDEDAFVIDNDALLKLLEYCIQEKIVNCGMRDGGVLPIRFGNPIVTNPFFNILDVKTIKKDYSIQAVSDFISLKKDYRNLLPKDMSSNYALTDNYESFYPFFIWLNVNHKVLYLHVTEHVDTVTTIVYNQLNQPMLYHSWYSRSFGMDQFHTDRIINLYHSCVNKDVLFSFSEKIKMRLEKFCNQKLIPFVLPIRRALIRLMK